MTQFLATHQLTRNAWIAMDQIWELAALPDANWSNQFLRASPEDLGDAAREGPRRSSGTRGVLGSAHHLERSTVAVETKEKQQYRLGLEQR